MTIQAPPVDNRNVDSVMEELDELVPFYVPELAQDEVTGPGLALRRIFAKLLEGIIHRTNEVLQEDLVSFLDTLGVQLLPARPARAPLTFALGTSAKESVVIPQRTQATATPAEGGDPIVFETERTILATPAHLTTVVTVVPSRDQIVDHSSNLAAGESTEFFADDGSHLQEHSLFLGDDNLFNISSAVYLCVKIDPPSREWSNSTSVRWEYCSGETETTKVPTWGKLMMTWEEKDQSVVLTTDEIVEIKQATINEVKARWIRCVVTGELAKRSLLSDLSIRKIAISFPESHPPSLDPDAACRNDVPIELPVSASKPVKPFGPRPRQGDMFYIASKEAFSKKGADVNIVTTAYPTGAKGISLIRVHGIGLVYMQRLREAGINTTTDLVKLTPAEVAKLIRNKEKNFPETRYINFSKNIIEAAAKQYYDKVVSTGGAENDESYVSPDLSWEYWNGKGWVLLEGLKDTTAKLLCPGVITFKCPDDIDETIICGVKDYWVRVRIVNGSYGEEEFRFDSDTKKTTTITSGIHPPGLHQLTITYTYKDGQEPSSILSLNNLDYRTITTLPAVPFVPLTDDSQTIYLGFDQAPLKGPISLFFSLEEFQYADAKRPRLEWGYFRRREVSETGKWAALSVTDKTKMLTESDTVEFYGSSDFAETTLFGQSLFWIRAVDLENVFQPSASGASGVPSASELSAAAKGIGVKSFSVRLLAEQLKRTRGVAAAGHALTKNLPSCEDDSGSFQPPFFSSSASSDCPAPVADGIYLNTTWAIQAETVEEEILGSSDGSQEQTFALTKFPVMQEEIWINEFSASTESERKVLAEAQPDSVEEVKDEEGTTTEFWIQWQSVDDLAESAATDRVYLIDRTFGKIQFGNGTNGKIPPLGKDNLVATYRSGGGSDGNVDVSEISAIRTTLPSVEKVWNPLAAGGGSDTELLADTLERGPWTVKSGGRAVTAEDFEWLAREASRAVARVKCLPNFDNRGRNATGWISVIIVPQSTEEQPVPSLLLRRSVQQYLADRCSGIVSSAEHLYVCGPTYVEVTVKADLVPLSMDLAPEAEAAARQAVQTFLHPLNGGYEGRGWEFGRLPALSDFYKLLEGIDGIDYVDALSIVLQVVTPSGAHVGEAKTVDESHPLDIQMPEYTLICSGDHLIRVALSTEDYGTTASKS